MKHILLTRGKEALVDDEDYEYLMQWKWSCGKRGYAVRKQTLHGRMEWPLMHREVAQRMGLSTESEIDHRNRNRLDNRRCNLRVANATQQRANTNRRRDNQSGYRGVYWHRAAGKWAAQIAAGRHTTYLGVFRDKVAAARAYNKAALEHFGEFAVLNPI